MAVACVDTSVLIDHYRATDKSGTFLFKAASLYTLHIPAIVTYEVLRGDAQKDQFWKAYFSTKIILPFDELCAERAATIYAALKRANQLIGAEDILIAAVALVNELPLLTLNAKHFSRIAHLNVITPGQLTV